MLPMISIAIIYCSFVHCNECASPCEKLFWIHCKSELLKRSILADQKERERFEHFKILRITKQINLLKSVLVNGQFWSLFKEGKEAGRFEEEWPTNSKGEIDGGGLNRLPDSLIKRRIVQILQARILIVPESKILSLALPFGEVYSKAEKPIRCPGFQASSICSFSISVNLAEYPIVCQD